MKKKPTKKRTLQDTFDSFSDRVWFDECHDRRFHTNPKKFIKAFKKRWGVEPEPRLYTPVCLSWSEKGRGFGQYTFWQEADGLHCDNECDSPETVKRVLCRMIDQCVFQDTYGVYEICNRCDKGKITVAGTSGIIKRLKCRKCDGNGKIRKKMIKKRTNK